MFLLEHPAGDPSAHTKRVAGDGSRRGRGAGTLVGLCEEVRGLEGCRQGPVLGICDSLPLDLTIVKSPALLENDPAFFFFSSQTLCELRCVPSYSKSEVFFSSVM